MSVNLSKEENGPGCEDSSAKRVEMLGKMTSFLDVFDRWDCFVLCRYRLVVRADWAMKDSGFSALERVKVQ